jgi:addiction module HigA family antidote
MFRSATHADAGPPHPGEILREDILPLLALSRRELARHLSISPRVLSEVLSERRAVTLDLAIGQGARYWLGLQAQHDVWRASLAEAAPVQPIAWGKRQRA